MNRIAATATATLIGILLATACQPKGTGGGGSGDKAEFCRLLETQYASFSKAQAAGDFGDPAKTKAYFIEQKAMSAKILAAAPSEVRADTELQVKNSNAVYDAQIAGNRDDARAKSVVLTSKENIDASRRMREFCGIKTSPPG